MPNFDQTGPQGQGKMTGRGMGRCGGNNTQGQDISKRQGQGKSRGQGREMGLGKKMGLGLNNKQQ